MTFSKPCKRCNKLIRNPSKFQKICEDCYEPNRIRARKPLEAPTRKERGKRSDKSTTQQGNGGVRVS